MAQQRILEDGREWNGLAYVHNKPVAGCTCGSCCGWFRTFWSDYPDATTERGWLKALTLAYDSRCWRQYTFNTLPIADSEVPGGWREQSTLGNYLDYGPCRPAKDGPQVHAVCYAANTSKYHATVAEAKAWIEAETRRVRPELFETGICYRPEGKKRQDNGTWAGGAK